MVIAPPDETTPCAVDPARWLGVIAIEESERVSEVVIGKARDHAAFRCLPSGAHWFGVPTAPGIRPYRLTVHSWDC